MTTWDVVSLESPEKINKFVCQSPLNHILQTFEWGEFQKQMGREVFRIGVVEDNEIRLSALLIKHSLPLGKHYLYCPRGPIFDYSHSRLGRQQQHVDHCFTLFLKKIRALTAEHGSVFFRIDPRIESDAKAHNGTQPFFVPKGFRHVSHEIQPVQNQIVDVSRSEDEMLAGMKSKTRYNIRLAKRKGVTITKSSKIEDGDEFWRLLKQTMKRDRFSAHPEKHYKKMLSILGPAQLLQVYSARAKGEVIVSALISFFGDTAIYLHGASSYKHRNLMAPHLLHWQAMRDAKNAGLKYYDFGGIAPKDQPRHPWQGITRFKQGFGGKRVVYIGTYDFVFRPMWYRAYELGKKLRKR